MPQGAPRTTFGTIPGTHQASLQVWGAATAGGAWVIPQPGFTSAELATRLAALLADPDALALAADAASGQGRADAAARLADLVEARMYQEARS